MKIQHNRFKDAPWFPKEDTFVLVGGAGGIGSWLSMLLSRANFKVIVYDFDLLEEHNLGGQLYSKTHLNKPKVEALQSVIQMFADEEITIFNEKYNEDSPANLIMFSAFDNMVARRIMFNNWLTNFGHDPNAIFIDGRLDAEQMQIFCIKGGAKNVNAQFDYLTNHLFNDSDVEDVPCTMKQTSHSAAMIASHMVGFFTNHITNVAEGEELRSIPFKWEYFIPMDLLSIEEVKAIENKPQTV